MGRKQAVGQWGEQMAEAYLAARGFRLVERNARTPYGEIDLVMQDEANILVFIEVKTRTSRAYGLPEEAITAVKRSHMLQSAEAFLQQHPEYSGDWRVDVIAIQKNSSSSPEIVWFENALT